MRFNEFNRRTDEIIPAIAAGARVAGMAAKGAGKLVGKGAQQAGQAAGRVGQQMGQKAKSAVKTVAQDAASKAMDKASDIAANKLLKVGSQIPIAGQLLKVDDVSGDEITIADPKNPKGPKTVLSKKSQEIKDIVAQLSSPGGQVK
jgi:hypothetical protein